MRIAQFLLIATFTQDTFPLYFYQLKVHVLIMKDIFNETCEN